MPAPRSASWGRRDGMSRLAVIATVCVLFVVAVVVLGAGAVFLLSARETAARNRCSDNQRSLVVAMQQYSAMQLHLPGWAEPMVSRDVEPAATPVSWVFPILPFLERGALHRKGTTAGEATFNQSPRDWPAAESGALHIKVLVCPSDPTAANSGMNLSYVANAGYRDRDAESVGPYAGGEPSYDGPEQDGPWSAVFLNRFQTAAAASKIPAQSPETLARGDGNANTFMFSENIHAGRWDLGSDLDPAAKPREGFVAFNFANTLEGGPSNQLRINGADGVARNVGEGVLPGANSYHIFGVVAAFCDGHASYFREDVDWKTWCLLFTPNGERLETTWPDGLGKPNVFKELILQEKF